MGWSVSTNAAAADARRSLSSAHGSLSTSLLKLSAGYRTNRATDDAGAPAIPQGLRSYAGRLSQAARNAEDGSSVVRTAECALTEVDSILHRIRDLAVRAGDDLDDAPARADLSTRACGLTSELTRIAGSTSFDGTTLLDGSAGTLTFLVGADGGAASRITVDLSGADVGTLADHLASAGPDLSSAAGARATIDTIDAQISAVSTARADLGVCQDRFERTIASAHVAVENLSASQSRVPDADLAAEMVTFAWAQILSQAGSAMLSQANSIPQGVFRLLG